jgi:hypothetical protein
MVAYGVGKICAVDGYGLLSVRVAYTTKYLVRLPRLHTVCSFYEFVQRTHNMEKYCNKYGLIAVYLNLYF